MPINWKSFRITRSISALRESPESGSYYHDKIGLLRVCSVVLKILCVKQINQCSPGRGFAYNSAAGFSLNNNRPFL